MKKRTILAFAVLAIVAPILIDWLIFGNSVPSNISNEAWASFLGSYIGGLCTLIALVATIHYYKESDKKKEKAAIQPFCDPAIYLRKNRAKSFKTVTAISKENPPRVPGGSFFIFA